jgi:hypothetical protein
VQYFSCRVTKFPQQPAEFYDKWQGKWWKKENLAEVNAACRTFKRYFSRYNYNFLTPSENRSQTVITILLSCQNHSAVNQLPLYDIILQTAPIKMLHWTDWFGQREQRRQSPNKSHLTIFHLKPFDNNRTAVSAMHLSCCWSERAPRTRIAARKKHIVSWQP